MTMLRTLTLPFIAVAGVLLLADPAIAQDDEIVVTGKLEIPRGFEPVSRAVNIDDLDLSKPRDADKMEDRVASAVRRVCSNVGNLRMRRYCHDYAWASARPQMERALDRARGG
ncbi:UrcA family protein [Erythrobacter insulae]|nr:UrcA family protein [Erythrobacter insulae]